MANDKIEMKRETVTLDWQRKGGAPAPRVDDYAECATVAPAAQAVARRQRDVPATSSECEPEFERRMDNWRRTVRFAAGRGGCCASWAALYIASRSKDGNGDEAPAMPRAIVTVDQLDGWLVEAAVRSMLSFEEKQALRYRYVWGYPEHWIRTKLRLRATGVRIVLARAQRNLKQILAKIENPARILTNNSHAGVDPRPESTDALVGAPSSLKTDAALID